MFFNEIKKLEEIEKTVCEHLMNADGLTDSSSVKQLKPIWVNYRHDMATMIGVLREYKDLLNKIGEANGNDKTGT